VTGPANEPLRLGNDLLRSAARLSRWASRHASFDVPFAQARLLALLDELGPSRVSALAAADHSSQPTITTQLQRLETAGWVHRAPDPDDARATVISLSDEGRTALESVRRARLAVLSPALEHLDASSRRRIRIAVDVMNELLAAASDSTTPPHPRKDG
jgi:DNA-binding MarR family transcriptional regulator